MTGSVLWLPDVASMLGFVVALLGTFPIVAPVWALPSLLLLRIAMLAPPLVALLVRGPQGAATIRHAGACWSRWASRSAGPTPLLPTHPSGRCESACSRCAMARAAPSKVLVVTGNEPGLDLGGTAPL